MRATPSQLQKALGVACRLVLETAPARIPGQPFAQVRRETIAELEAALVELGLGGHLEAARRVLAQKGRG